MSENILVFKRALLDELGSFQGALSGPTASLYLSHILDTCNWEFKERPAMEIDPSYKQIIPYCVLTEGENVYYYQRTKMSGETRLHGNYSVGFGGHINDKDVKNGKVRRQLFFDALHRELEEELDMSGAAWTMKFVGMLNDESNPVGQVHFGLVYKLVLVTAGKKTIKTVDEEGKHHLEQKMIQKIKLREDAHRNLSTDTLSVLKTKAAAGEMVFENWSKLVLENLL